MRWQKVNRLLVVIALLIPSRLLVVTIGSDTAVTRFTAQQELADGDRIAGFASLEGGFALIGPSVSATFDSFFPVSGAVEINGGTLTLNRDLILSNVATIGILGDIYGNGHSFELAPTVTCMPSIDSDTACRMFVITEIEVGDNVETLDWSFNDLYIGVGTDILVLTDPLSIYSFNGSTLSLLERVAIGDGTETEINSVRWHPSRLSLAIARQSSGDGDEIFVYSFNGSTLTQESSAEYAADCNACAWHTSGDYLIVGGENVTEEIRMYPVSSSDILGTPVAVDTSGRSISFEAMEFDATGSYLAVGTADPGGVDTTLVYEFNDQPSLSLSLNASVDPGEATFAVSWNKTYTDVFAIGLAGTSTTRVIIYRHDAGAGTLTQINTISTPFSSPIESLQWTINGACLVVGSDEVGTGPEDARFVTYTYNNTTGSLSQVLRIDEGDDVEAIRASSNERYFAYGDDGFEDPINLTVLDSGFGLLTDSCPTFSDLHLVLNCNVCLESCCLIFSGNCSINGQGYCLDMGPTCSLVVDSDSSLLIKDIELKNLSGTQLHGIDMSSTISFQDVTIVLDDNFTFTQGRFDVTKDLNVKGNGHQFTYQSEAQSKIQKCGMLLLDRGVTFSYDPPIASQELLLLTDDTSKLTLNGATFHTTTTGYRMTRGILDVRAKSFISAESDTEDTGFMFGDATAGTSVDLNVRSAAMLDYIQGCVQVDTV